MRYSDYNSYLTHLRQTKLCNYLSNCDCNTIADQISKLNAEVEFLRKTQQVYITKTPTFGPISTTSLNTFIVKPVDLITDYFSIFMLQANNDQLANGIGKNIMNTCTITSTKNIYIYSVNSTNGLGGFNHLGTLYNCYVFASNGDSLELVWDSIHQNWCVQKYGGIFKNYII
jgi:hypothetical protein